MSLIELEVAERVVIPHGKAGVVLSATEVEIPEGYIGILSPRRSYGQNCLFITSQFLEGGFKGKPELHLYNKGNDLELMSGQRVVNLAIVKGLSA